MQGNKLKRLAELERSLAATHEQAIEKHQEALWAQFSDDELEQVIASVARREQPGYVLTAEDKAIERRWYEAVQATLTTVTMDQRAKFEWRAWAVEWGKAVRRHS
jgi:tRNA pseudouridine-54 N-methylase